MGISACWDCFADWIMHFGMPSVLAYHVLSNSVFLNVSATDAQGLERVSNVLLTPAQYLLAGYEADPCYDPSSGAKIGYALKQRFDYRDSQIWYKTALSYVALPSSLILGSAAKGISYLSPKNRERAREISSSQGSRKILSHEELYRKIGIVVSSIDEAEKIRSLGYSRREKDLHCLRAEKVALQEIVSLLHRHRIVYWMDCGSCLGAYRYGGVIPWDWDIDIAVLQPDFDNVKNILHNLDPAKYMVQDWSSRDKPKTYLKVYVKETDSLIDIYHFAVDPENQSVHSILSNEDSIFLSDSWKIRERRYTIPTHFDLIFPLKKADFDGVEVFVPNKVEQYLQQRYGEDLRPVKILNPITEEYEKDLSHPYWQMSHMR